LKVNGTAYKWLAFNYVLAPAENTDVADVTFEFSNDQKTLQSQNIPAVNFKRNHRTNILGRLITGTASFEVTIDDEPMNDFENVWDGVSVKQPNVDENGVYLIAEPAELAWVAASVNGTLSRATVHNDFAGKTFKMTTDLNLAGYDWTPIGISTNLSNKETFRGTFDGNGYTISNLTCNQKAVAGLFGYVYGATIKNLTINNAELNSNHYAGGVVAWVLNNKGNIQVPFVMENCHVKNSTITSTPEEVDGEWDNGDKIGGLAGYALFEGNDGAVIKDCSVENTTIKAYRDFGGLLGYAKGVALENCTVKDVTLEQDLTHDYKYPDTPDTFSLGIGRNDDGNTVDKKPYFAWGVEQVDDYTFAVTKNEGWDWVVSKVAENNGFEGKMDFVCCDVFDLLTDMANKKQPCGYDFIILDPPAFTKSRDTLKNAIRGYREINSKAMKLLPRGGYLATCSCSHFMTDTYFKQMLHNAAEDAGVSLRQIEARQQSPDHPILWNVPETDYLKFYIFQIV
jgi:hypothetical protein